MATKPSVLFLCTGNCCRSQMGEGLMRAMADGQVEVFSAGSDPAGYVHRLAIEVMAEAGIDISGHRSKSLAELGRRRFDYVVTVCDSARQACPTLTGEKGTYHWPIEDPALVPDDAEALEAARRVREDLKERIAGLLESWGIEARA